MNHERLYKTESRLLTRIGKAFLTERVVMHGKDLHHELDHLEWLHLYIYAILGRDPGSIHLAKPCCSSSGFRSDNAITRHDGGAKYF